MNVDLRSLRAFVELSRTLSFTRAAERLSITQPQLSMTLRGFEDRLGFRLFDRSSRRVSITPQGQALLVEATEIVERLDRFGQHVQEIRFDQRTTLKIGAINYGRAIRRHLVSRYMALYPDVTVEVEAVRRHEEALVGLAEARWDVAVALELDAHPIAPDLETVLLGRMPVGLLIDPASDLARHDLVPPDALRDRQVALFRRDISPTMHDAMLQRLAPYDVRIVRLTEASEEGVHDFVRETGIPAMCARWWNRPEDQPRDVAHRRIAGEGFEISCVLARHRRQATPAGDSLWRLARRFAADTSGPTIGGSVEASEPPSGRERLHS